MKIFKVSPLVPLGVAIAAALVTQTTQASIIHNLVVTENSSTSLTATYDNSTARVSVTPVGQDEWKVSVSSTILNFNAGASWAEPTGSLSNTIVGVTLEGSFDNPTTVLDIKSDFSVGGSSTLPNGSTILAGTDNLDGASIQMTFTDRGDVASASEKGSTFGLLALAFGALAGASRLRCLRLANM
jgi:hypothetical protein